jgi:2'-5' RNA ligase
MIFMPRRLFLALNPCAGAIDRLRQTVVPLMEEPWARVRWLPPDQWHVTVRYLGETPEGDMAERVRMLAPVAAHAAEMTPLAISTLALWPNPAKPRVLVVTAESAGWVEAMAQCAEVLAREAGYRAEMRPFRPHLTLARLGGGAVPSAGRAMLADAAQVLRGTTLAFESLSLFASRTPPEGPWFERLATVRLPGA